MTKFAIKPTSNPTSAAKRAELLASPKFGRVFTDHMAVIKWSEERGWHDAEITTRAPLSLDPAAAVLHYAQEIFEGLKAYRRKDGSITLFRPEKNAERYRKSARRMQMPELPEALFLESVTKLVQADKDWVPTNTDSSLYLRPFMFASEVFLGVKPASEYLHIVIASPVGAYFAGGKEAVKIWVSEHTTRAASGGTGAAKCGGNYAASLLAQAQATQNGCDQVVFLDAVEHKWVEELGGMNVFFVFNNGEIVTPPLTDTILPGITRDCVLTLAKNQGLTVHERRYSIDDWRADAASGKLVEAFACGTAAVIAPIGEIRSTSGNTVIGSGGAGQMATKLRSALIDIQYGRAADPFGWVHKITD